MRFNKTLSMLLVCAIIGASALVVMAGEFRSHHSKSGMELGFCGLKGLRQLDLSDEQKSELAEIFNHFRDESAGARQQLLATRKQFQTATQAETFNAENVRQTFRQMSPAMEEMAVLRAKLMADVKPVLTADQLELLEQKRSEFRDRMDHHRQAREDRIDDWLQPSGE